MTDRRALLQSITLRQAIVADPRIARLFEVAVTMQAYPLYRKDRTYSLLKQDLCEMVGCDADVLELRHPRYIETLLPLLYDALPEEVN